MRKILVGLLCALPLAAFAGSDLDMSNLKCGSLQIYANTTLKQVRDNCLVDRQFVREKVDSKNFVSDPAKGWEGQRDLYEVQFKSTTAKELVRCDFLQEDDNAVVIGCR